MRRVARPAALLLVAALAACAAPQNRLSTRLPSVSVAEAALQAGAPETALHVAQAILADRPGDTRARLCEANANYQLGHTAEAESGFRRVLASDPASVPARLGLGRALLSSSPAQAEAMFRQVLLSAPTDVAALTDLGIAQDLQGRHTDAQQSYRQALALQPGLVSARTNLELSQSLSEDSDAARAGDAPVPPLYRTP